MKFKKYFVLFGVLLCNHNTFAVGRYFQLLTNNQIAEVRVVYSVYEGASLEPAHRGKLLHNSQQAWMLDGHSLIQQISRLSADATVGESAPKSNPSQYIYDYENLSFSDSTNNLTVLESQMNRIAAGNWIPPLPETGHTSFEIACPLLGCFVAGNPYIERYEGAYTIRAQGEEVFKGVRCIKYTYAITGPFSTYFKTKGMITENEDEAHLKLQQDLTVKGTILVDVAADIIYARSEETQFKVIEAMRVDLASKWVKTSVHADITQSKSWVVDSVTTVYRQ